MTKKRKARSDQEVSAGRRDFFRQIFVSAVETVEKVGREMQYRTRFPFDHDSHTSYSPITKPYPQYVPPGHDPYGPPWPPPAGPPVPPGLLTELDGMARRSIARGDESADAADHD